MNLSVKNKIRAGTIFLFLLLLISGGMGIYYVVQLKKDAQVILKNNYESVDYSNRMLQLLDSISINREHSLLTLDSVLQRQSNNITEPGEREATSLLQSQLLLLQRGDSSSAVFMKMRQQLQYISTVNLHAIEVKNKRAVDTADNALTYLTLIASLIFLVAITFAYNFPFIVTGPIRQLTEGIEQIGIKNYRHRIHLDRQDEFGRMADAYNTVAERLEYFENSNLNKILFEKNRAEAVINSLKDAGIGIDANNKVLFANNLALEILELSTDEIVGLDITEVSRKNDLFRFLIDDSNTSPFKIVINNRENYFIKEVIDVNPEEGSGNRVILLKNITSFKELDVAKTNFIATISHELKTPLASSDFGIKLLEDQRIGALSPEQKDIVDQLRQDNQRMLRILSELLNLSQAETGKMDLHPAPVPATAIVERSLSFVQASAARAGIRIVKDIAADLPPVYTDQEKTAWVLTNFLTNAIKFSPADSTVTVSVQQQGNGVIFKVSDQGTGIEAQYLPKLFDRYFKVPGNTQSGNGLGLAISKEIIEALKGSIAVESTTGEGSSFSFRIPLAE